MKERTSIKRKIFIIKERTINKRKIFIVKERTINKRKTFKEKSIEKCSEQKENSESCDSELKATPGIEPGIKVLQTRALPLGYVARVTPSRFELLLPP